MGALLGDRGRFAGAILALACLLAALSALGPATEAEARTRCGTIGSTSIYDRARVIAIRGVQCPKARKVARRYDHDGKQTGRWQCFLAHDDPPRLFSCGWGQSQGDIRDAPHALIAKGVNR